MTLLLFNGVFDVIELQMAESDAGEVENFEVPGSRAGVPLSWQEARKALYGTQRDEVLSEAIWRRAVYRARRDGTPEGLERLRVLWLALPGLRRTVRRASFRLYADRRELEAEAMLSLVEVLDAVEPQASHLGRSLVGTACNRVWAAAGRMAKETPMADVPLSPGALDAVSPYGGEPALVPPGGGWELLIDPPARADGLAASIRFTAPSAQLQNEWLSDLAGSIGLGDIVHRARRPGEGTRVGTLSLRPAGDGR
ncbi:hypothetical protein B7C62_18225 [Kitasatospora albolonga]|uniref:Uncharacterized protein n=1 Tax=Kitasatospora albolonga TaxID=68173 RepID=A0ABC8BUT1_9ACTN|nr:hypothetical protein B7C62_18225 [Kitasatospora albolonga]